MKLGAFKLDNIPVSELQSYSTNDLNGNPAYIFAENLSSSYADITTIENLSEHGHHTGRDYKFIRSEINTLYDSSTWSELSDDEKSVCSIYFICSPTEAADVHDVPTRVAYGELFHINSVESRMKRISRAMSEARTRIQQSDVQELIDDLESSNLLDTYITFGREGTIEGDPEGLFDWVESRAGTSFDGIGMSSKSYTVEGYSDMSDFTVYIMDIIKTGNY